MEYVEEDSDNEFLPYFQLRSLLAEADGGRMVHPLPILKTQQLQDTKYLAEALKMMRQNMTALQQGILELSTIVKTEIKRRPTYSEI